MLWEITQSERGFKVSPVGTPEARLSRTPSVSGRAYNSAKIRLVCDLHPAGIVGGSPEINEERYEIEAPEAK